MTIYDCPIMDFQEAEAGNFEKIREGEFETLCNELINEFGLTEINQIIFHKRKQIVKLEAKKIYTGDERLDIHIQIAERELQSLLSKCHVPEDIRKLQATNHRVLTKWSGRDSTKLTVFYYYNDLRDYEKEQNAEKNRQRYNTHSGYSRSNPKGT